MPPSRGLVIGCGGALGFAWTVAALRAVEDALGWAAYDAQVLVGTSAGAEIVAAFGCGVESGALADALTGASKDEVLTALLAHDAGMRPPLPGLGLAGLGLTLAGLRGKVPLTSAVAGLLPRGRGDASWLVEYGDALAARAGANAWTSHPQTWLVTADCANGERIVLGRDLTTSLGTGVAASWAIPGWFPPVEVGGRRLMDGGALSPTSADLLVGTGVDEVIVIAPMASAGGAPAQGLARAERLLRTSMTRRLDDEQRLLEQAGVRVVRIEPGPEDLAAMGANFMDVRRRETTFETATRTSPARVAAAIERPTHPVKA